MRDKQGDKKMNLIIHLNNEIFPTLECNKLLARMMGGRIKLFNALGQIPKLKSQGSSCIFLFFSCICFDRAL